jgi:hypothetical protein
VPKNGHEGTSGGNSDLFNVYKFRQQCSRSNYIIPSFYGVLQFLLWNGTMHPCSVTLYVLLFAAVKVQFVHLKKIASDCAKCVPECWYVAVIRESELVK